MKQKTTNFALKKFENIFTSKTNVLKYLGKKITNSEIEKIFDFTVSEWKSNRKNILKSMYKKFGTCKLIVRSSAKGEDSIEKSFAGSYLSIQNVKSNSNKDVIKAVNQVIESYSEKQNDFNNNQILVQKQTKNVILSGVIFTGTPNYGSPYYVINFEEGSSTDGVTQGKVNNSVIIFKKISPKKIPKKFKHLIIAVKEIEKIFLNQLLDIEFAITNKGVVNIFQVRPITSTQIAKTKNLENKIKYLIRNNEDRFLHLNKKSHRILGKKTIFADMTDWNPAEIIGNEPNILDYSLYEFLIMKDIWAKSRSQIGYQKVEPHNLMVKFGNKPYVDVRASFNSFLPKNLKPLLKQKLVNHYLEKLIINPHLHDKVEFEIVFSCFDLSLENKLKKLVKEKKFSNKEINEIQKELLYLTNNIINEFPNLSVKSSQYLKTMSNNRQIINSRLRTGEKNYKDLLLAAEKLLKDCRKYGTLPFSTMARIAFIATILVKSVEKEGFASPKFSETIMNGIKTPASQLQQDYNDFCSEKISKKALLSKYGHLRPGTYDINAKRYDQQKIFFENLKFLKKPKLKTEKITDDFVPKLLKNHGLKFENIDFYKFVKTAISQRESLKFEFTRNLSDAIECIAEAGIQLGFSRSDISNLGIQTILNYYKKFTKNELRKFWKNKIEVNLRNKKINRFLVLPPIIFSNNDFEKIMYHFTKPNFITQKNIIEDTIYIDKNDERIPNLNNKIVVIENADPGFDWIFTRNPIGLITKYGGVASHMAIRCSEMSLPAAIGCGELLFGKLKNSSKIQLDCSNEQIIVLENKHSDEKIEVKKALKSLGYIK